MSRDSFFKDLTQNSGVVRLEKIDVNVIKNELKNKSEHVDVIVVKVTDELDDEQTNVNITVLEDINANSIVDEEVHKNVHVKSSAKLDWKPKKNSFEANYTRKTLWLRDDLLKSLNDLSVSKGDITSIINACLEAYFKKINKKNEKESEL